MLTQYVRVDPQCDGRIGVAEAGSYHMDGDPGEQQAGQRYAKRAELALRRLTCDILPSSDPR